MNQPTYGQRDRSAYHETNRRYHPRWYERRSFAVACYIALFLVTVKLALSLFLP